MGKGMRRGYMTKLSKNRRAFALGRAELRQPSESRESVPGATSFPLKAQDPELRRLIDEALARRQP